MKSMYNILVKLIIFTIFLILFYYCVALKYVQMLPLRKSKFNITYRNLFEHFVKNDSNTISNGNYSLPVIYIWCIVVKIENNDSLLIKKFDIFLKSLLYHSKSLISFNVLTDDKSKLYINNVISEQTNETDFKFYEVVFYDIQTASNKVNHITRTMQVHFSSVPGTYYSHSLFYISLGLHKIAPLHHYKIILLDIDIKFRSSVVKLYKHFSNFGSDALFGLAPELSPVYHHILWKWKQSHPNSSFGEPYGKGFSGLNSGVVLMDLDRIRKSEVYSECIGQNYIDRIVKKYVFKGHLGDQDFYTLLAIEKPNLVNILPCSWNVQLCQWWKYHGYASVFEDFSRCDITANIYHGNCNTPIPVS